MKPGDRRGARLSAWTVFLLAVAILTPAFLSNPWLAVGEDWFLEWRTAKDASFVGRLVESRQDGVLSHAAFLGLGDTSLFNSPQLLQHQYDTYLTTGQFVDFRTYNSVIGLQALVFGMLGDALNLPPDASLLLFQCLTALLSAMSLGLVAVWIHAELGLTAGIFTIGFMAVSEWLTLFGGSIYWSLWSFYLLPIGAAYAIRQDLLLNHRGNGLLRIVFVATLIKCMFNGFEFITTALLMAYTPVIYYALRDGWGLVKIAKRCVSVAAAQAAAATIGLGILIYQNAVVLGSPDKAIGYIGYTLGKRSLGNPSEYPGQIAESLRASLFPVVQQYIVGRAIQLDFRFLPAFAPNLPAARIEIGYASVFLFFILAFAAYALLRSRVATGRRIRISSLLITTILSLVAPLSWYVLFKAHSYLHPHLDFIVWQMPTVLLGFGVCGAIAQSLLEAILRRSNAWLFAWLPRASRR